MPETILPELEAQLEYVITLHQKDLEAGYAGTFLMGSLEKKYKKKRGQGTRLAVVFSRQNLDLYCGIKRIPTLLSSPHPGPKGHKKSCQPSEDSQACIRAHISPQFCQSSIAGQLRYPNRSAASGAQRREDDHDLYPYDPKPDHQGGQKST